MGPREVWTRFATRHKIARMVVLGAVDLCLAVGISTGFFLTFGVFSNDRLLPPTCANYFGHEVNCSLDGPMNLAAWVLLGALFAGLLAFHALQGRPRLHHRAPRPS